MYNWNQKFIDETNWIKFVTTTNFAKTKVGFKYSSLFKTPIICNKLKYS